MCDAFPQPALTPATGAKLLAGTGQPRPLTPEPRHSLGDDEVSALLSSPPLAPRSPRAFVPSPATGADTVMPFSVVTPLVARPGGSPFALLDA